MYTYLVQAQPSVAIVMSTALSLGLIPVTPHVQGHYSFRILFIPQVVWVKCPRWVTYTTSVRVYLGHKLVSYSSFGQPFFLAHVASDSSGTGEDCLQSFLDRPLMYQPMDVGSSCIARDSSCIYRNAKLWWIISPRWLLRLTHGGRVSESIPTICIWFIRALCQPQWWCRSNISDVLVQCHL